MAMIEMQIRQDVFFDAIKAELLRIPVPSDVVDTFALGGLLIERIEIPEVTVAGETPKLGPVPKGRLHLKVKLQIFLTTYANARLAGHLAVPATITEPAMFSPFEVTFWIRFTLSHQKVITYEVVEVDANREFHASGTLNLGIPLPLEITAFATAILANDGVVAIRMGTDKEDLDNEQAFLDWWGGNRLGTAQWGAFIAGTVFGHQIAKQLNRTAKQIADASSDPKIEVTYPMIAPPPADFPHHNGTWILPQRYAEANVKLNAIDAGFLDADVSFEITVTVEIQPYLGTAVKLNTRVQWDAPDEVSDAIADMARNVFGKQQETAHGDDFVAFSTTHFLEAPRSRAFSGQIGGITVDDNGLAITGSLQVRPRPSATWTATPPSWTFSGDCHSKSVGLKLKPPAVALVGSDPYVELWPLLTPKSEPLLFWEPFDRRSLPGALPVTLEVEFRIAGRLLGDVPSGVPVSAYLYTNLGVRWINFGTVPPKPSVSEKELLARTFHLISNCMAISDRWGMGVLNLDWLVDPPDLALNFGFPPLQEWFVLGEDVREVEVVQLTAVRRDGQRRSLGSASVAGGVMLLHQIITGAEETLELRTGVAMAGPAPQIMRRWIVPQRIIPFERTVASFALDGPFLRILYDDGSSQELQIEGDAVETVRHIADGERMWHEIERGNADHKNDVGIRPLATVVYRHRYHVKTALHTIIESSGSVAVLHDNKIILGVAGRFEPAVGSAPENARPAATMSEGKKARLN